MNDKTYMYSRQNLPYNNNKKQYQQNKGNNTNKADVRNLLEVASDIILNTNNLNVPAYLSLRLKCLEYLDLIFDHAISDLTKLKGSYKNEGSETHGNNR